MAARLSEERARLATLLSEQTPGGMVDPAAFDAQLAQDTVYQEDFKEFRAEGVQYRTELGVALLMCSDPAAQVQKSLQKLAKTLGEQRELSPPPAVAAVLERTTADVAQAYERMVRFIDSWQVRTEAAGRLNVDQDVVEAVKLQNAAADEVHGVVDAVQKIVDDARARIEALERDSNGGTREVVVASVLRGELSGLSVVVQALAEAAKATDLTANFRLETHDRQLRGLRTRLAQRRDALNQQMQFEADRIARQEHTQQIEKTRDAVREAEQRREELVTALMSKLDLVREFEQEAVQRDQALARRRQIDERTAWLNGCIAQLDEKLAQARRSGPKPDRIERDDPLVTPIESHRTRHAGIAAAAGFAAAGLIGLLMLVRNPLRRRATTPRLLDLLVSERTDPAPARDPGGA